MSLSSSSESDGAKKKKKKRSRISMWEYIEDTWPVSLRPPKMRKKSYVNKLTMKEVESLFNMHCSREKSLRGQKMFQAVSVETSHPTVHYKKGKDNCKTRLHRARFQRLPLTSPEAWFKKVPLKRSPVIRQLPLEYTGGHEMVSEKIIEVLHDRSKALTLREFYSKNYEAASKSLKDGESTASSDWVNFEGLQGVQEAFCNFGAVYHNLWPNDPTPNAFWRTLIDYNWGSSLRNPKLQERLICDYFEKVTKKNANRAVRKEAPCDQAKHEDVFRQICRDLKVNPDDLLFGIVHTPVAGPKKATHSASKTQKAQGGGAGKSGAKAAAAKPTDKRGWPTYEGLGVCFGFNSVEEAKKCKNTAHEKGCEGKDKQGAKKIYAHVCSNWLEGKGYCLGAHKKQDCKGDK